MASTESTNAEPLVACPVDGCSKTTLSRGIQLHVRQSSGDGHGPQGETPSHLDFTDLDVVGERAVSISYPESRDDDTVSRLCPVCRRVFSGYRAVTIHLGQVSGTRNHPDDISDHITIEDCPQVRVDENDNVLDILETGNPDLYPDVFRIDNE